MLNRPHILLNKPTLLFFQKHKPRSCQYNAILKTGKFRLGGTPGCLSCKQVVRQGCWESWVVLYPLSKTHKGGDCTLSSLGSCSHRQNVHLCAWVEPAVFQLTPAVSCLLLCAAVNPWSSGSAPNASQKAAGHLCCQGTGPQGFFTESSSPVPRWCHKRIFLPQGSNLGLSFFSFIRHYQSIPLSWLDPIFLWILAFTLHSHSNQQFHCL